MTETSERDGVTKVAEAYYDSGDADAFYFHVWGGEDIHIGLYERPDEPIFDASRRSTEALARRLELKASHRVLDLGAGYGGAARWVAETYGCRVACLNLSEVQNDRNRVLSKAQGLSDRIEVVHGAFETLPFPAESFDHAFSQDAFLHSGDKGRVLEEAFRVLKPGGHLVFTDPMQADSVPSGVLEPVLARIHLDHLGSFGLYHGLAQEAGFEVVDMVDMTKQLPSHYQRVSEELGRMRSELEGRVVSGAYLDRMLKGLGHWVEAGRSGHLAWGIIDLKKPT